MPITQSTLLSLYGQIHELAVAIENLHAELRQMRNVLPPAEFNMWLELRVTELRHDATRAERQGIADMLGTGESIQINPITGEVD